nr:MAG TPA: hypothetical protein [Caudoviricetes sp.]
MRIISFSKGSSNETAIALSPVFNKHANVYIACLNTATSRWSSNIVRNNPFITVLIMLPAQSPGAFSINNQ